MKKTINALFTCCLVALLGWMLINILHNIDEQNLEFGFDFLFTRSGFDMGDAWILHNSNQTYIHAIFSGLYNTLLLALACIFLSTLLGTFFAILSTTHTPWLTNISRVYINIFRNIPLLVQILFVYTLMVYWLPPVRESLQIGDIYLCNRGLFFPKVPLMACWPLIFFPLMHFAPIAKAHRIQSSIGFLALWFLSLLFFDWEVPEKTRFSLLGGGQLGIEWLTLLIALSIYSSSYIAECIRGGINAISKHQIESAQSLGLKHLQIMTYIILPQAKPIFMPSLLNQYLNLTKNISLAIAIGYPDFFGITAGTILNQSGRSLECIIIVITIYGLINIIGTHFIEKISHPHWKSHARI